MNACVYFRPGGELNSGEDQVEGLKRLLTEVIVVKVEKKPIIMKIPWLCIIQMTKRLF